MAEPLIAVRLVIPAIVLLVLLLVLLRWRAVSILLLLVVVVLGIWVVRRQRASEEVSYMVVEASTSNSPSLPDLIFADPSPKRQELRPQVPPARGPEPVQTIEPTEGPPSSTTIDAATRAQIEHEWRQQERERRLGWMTAGIVGVLASLAGCAVYVKARG